MSIDLDKFTNDLKYNIPNYREFNKFKNDFNKENKYGFTILNVILKYYDNCYDVVKHILENYDVDVNYQNKYKNTSLFYLLGYNHSEYCYDIFNLLVSHGVNVNITNKYGNRPIYFLFKYNKSASSVKICDLLIKNGLEKLSSNSLHYLNIDVNNKNSIYSGNNNYHKNSYNICELLIKNNLICTTDYLNYLISDIYELTYLINSIINSSYMINVYELLIKHDALILQENLNIFLKDFSDKYYDEYNHDIVYCIFELLIKYNKIDKNSYKCIILHYKTSESTKFIRLFMLLFMDELNIINIKYINECNLLYELLLLCTKSRYCSEHFNNIIYFLLENDVNDNIIISDDLVNLYNIEYMQDYFNGNVLSTLQHYNSLVVSNTKSANKMHY